MQVSIKSDTEEALGSMKELEGIVTDDQEIQSQQVKLPFFLLLSFHKHLHLNSVLEKYIERKLFLWPLADWLQVFQLVWMMMVSDYSVQTVPQILIWIHTWVLTQLL